ncbi:MAG: alpha-amylase family glycosyl hydrolase, partial [Pseudomonadota bacterium]
MIGATYRLQFRSGIDFAAAAALAPHLAALGITHLYASPIFAAEPGSTHGYDVTDHNAFDPTLGTADDFAAMVAALKANGLSLMLDIVPNHMAASPNNSWWRDVLRHGRASRYARHFDIDWSAEKLVLPVLGKPYGDALAAGEITRGT